MVISEGATAVVVPGVCFLVVAKLGPFVHAAERFVATQGLLNEDVVVVVAAAAAAAKGGDFAGPTPAHFAFCLEYGAVSAELMSPVVGGGDGGGGALVVGDVEFVVIVAPFGVVLFPLAVL